MAFSWSEQTVPAGTALIPVDIEYLDKSYIYLYLDGTLVPNSAYTWNSAQVIQLVTPTSTTTKVLLVRRTDKEFLYIAFAEGAAFIKENIDTQNKQFLHLVQEMVEGRAIEGFYGDISMNGYKITNLAAGTASTDAVNKGQLDSVEQRVSNLEGTFVNSTSSYPWYTIATVESDTFTPGFIFDKAAVYIDGICQVPGYSYIVVDNQILLAEPVPVGTIVAARLGQDVNDSDGFATAEQFAGFVQEFRDGLAGKANKGANSDITSLSGLTTPLSVAQGGTGNSTGKAPSAITADSATTAGSANTAASADQATKLTTARTITVNLASTTGAGFDGTANVTPGVSGVLPLARGGTGQSTAAAARAALGAAASAGVTDASDAAAGVVGEVLTSTSSTDTSLTTATVANVISLALTPGDWDLYSTCYIAPTGATLTESAACTTLTSGSFETLPYRVSIGGSMTTSMFLTLPFRRVSVSANTTVYLTVRAVFASGTAVARGSITARRAR